MKGGRIQLAQTGGGEARTAARRRIRVGGGVHTSGDMHACGKGSHGWKGAHTPEGDACTPTGGDAHA
jgi:hypothetical protein